MRIKGFKDGCGGIGRPLRRLHARYSAAFLIDKYRQLVPSGKRAQVIGQRAQLTSLLYIAANGLKVVALNFGPMTVLSSLFTTLLVFNLVIANKLLDEVITPPKVAGAIFIVAGAGVCSIATPKDLGYKAHYYGAIFACTSARRLSEGPLAARLTRGGWANHGLRRFRIAST